MHLGGEYDEKTMEGICGRNFERGVDCRHGDARTGGAGVINGIKEGGEIYFKPLNPITRAEVAAVAGRMAKPETRIRK